MFWHKEGVVCDNLRKGREGMAHIIFFFFFYCKFHFHVPSSILIMPHLCGKFERRESRERIREKKESLLLPLTSLKIFLDLHEEFVLQPFLGSMRRSRSKPRSYACKMLAYQQHSRFDQHHILQGYQHRSGMCMTSIEILKIHQIQPDQGKKEK